MTDYTNLMDDDEFTAEAYDWPYRNVQDGVILYATDSMDDAEAGAYIRRAREYFKPPLTVFAIVDGENVELHYVYGQKNFERIRRITGYLVGTLDRFNDGKRAEEAERVRHRIV